MGDKAEGGEGILKSLDRLLQPLHLHPIMLLRLNRPLSQLLRLRLLPRIILDLILRHTFLQSPILGLEPFDDGVKALLLHCCAFHLFRPFCFEFGELCAGVVSG